MVHSYQLLLQVFGGLLFSFLTLSFAVGQSAPIPLQQVRFTSKVVEDRLINYARRSKARFINLSIRADTVSKATSYVLGQLNCYEEIADFNLSTWGQWRNTVILFYPSQVDLTAICTIGDTTTLTYLKRYASTLLPRAIVDIPGTNIQELCDCHGGYMSVRFTVRNGRIAEYDEYSGGCDASRNDYMDASDSLPPVPESSKK